MRKTILSLLLSLCVAPISHAGLSIGLPGAVKKQVDKLDEKVLASKLNNLPAANSSQAGNGAAQISWTSRAGASSYNLYWGNSLPLQSSSKIASVTSPYILTGLTNGVTCYYALSSMSGGIESNRTAVEQVVPSALLPLRPDGLTRVNGYEKITVSWNAVSGASSYDVYWGDAAGVTKFSTKITGVTGNSYAHAGLTPGQIYYYRVVAVNGAGESVLSEEISGMPKVYTTLGRTLLPVLVPSSSPKIHAYELAKYTQYGYGVLQYGPGLPLEKRLDLMPAGYSSSAATNAASLVRFFAMTDIHITDKESPAQAIYYGYYSNVISSYSGIMLYTTRFLDAAIQTINSLHKENQFDFGIALGDLANNTQYNELRWFIDVFDGKRINPDSGAKDDPIPGPDNDYQDEYQSVGLDKSIKWYATLGNHDHFWMGTNPVDDYIRDTYVNDKILNMGNIFTNPLGIKSRGLYMGAFDGRTLYGDVIGVGPVENFTIPPTIRGIDQNRRSLRIGEWMGEFFNTSSSPIGHGFNHDDIAREFPCYTFEPKSTVPLKVIVLDDTSRDTDPNTKGWGQGSLDQARYDWLVSELDKGQAEGKLMIIAAHVPIGVVSTGPLAPWMDWSANAFVTEKNLIAKLHTYPNLIMWIAGHRHLNVVTPLPSPDPSHPELGFWVVETSSLREFPQEFRTFDVLRNTDNTVSVLAVDVDPVLKDGSFPAISRSYAIGAMQAFSMDQTPLVPYDAELVKQLSVEMQAKIRSYGTPLPQ